MPSGQVRASCAPIVSRKPDATAALSAFAERKFIEAAFAKITPPDVGR
jgi:hypothetical protein